MKRFEDLLWNRNLMFWADFSDLPQRPNSAGRLVRICWSDWLAGLNGRHHHRLDRVQVLAVRVALRWCNIPTFTELVPGIDENDALGGSLLGVFLHPRARIAQGTRELLWRAVRVIPACTSVTPLQARRPLPRPLVPPGRHDRHIRLLAAAAPRRPTRGHQFLVLVLLRSRRVARDHIVVRPVRIPHLQCPAGAPGDGHARQTRLPCRFLQPGEAVPIPALRIENNDQRLPADRDILWVLQIRHPELCRLFPALRPSDLGPLVIGHQ